MRKAEKERADHARRLEVLEELCRHHLGGLEARLSQASQDAAAEVEKAAQRMRNRFDREVRQISEAVSAQTGELKDAQEQGAEAVKALSRRVDSEHAVLEELKAWRAQAENRLAAAAAEAAGAAAPSSLGSHRAAASTAAPATALGGGYSDGPEERLEVALARERKQAHERLRSSCAELTAHLNDLRRELVEQRRVSELSAADSQARDDALHRELKEHHADLEAQIAELGGALASRLQAKVLQLAEDYKKDVVALQERIGILEKSDEWFEGQVQLWRHENVALHGAFASLKDPGSRELEDLTQVAKDEARTVHMEVMSLDTRVAAIEERLAEDPGRRRYEALLSRNSPSAAAAAAVGGRGAGRVVETARGGAAI